MSHILQKLDLKSGLPRSSSLKNVRGFASKRRKSRKAMYEKIPLKSPDSDTSDEELLHDIRHLKKHSKSASNLRKINKLDSASSNGVTQAPPKQNSDPFENCDFLHLELEDGDSLESLSIKYHCAVSDIKRANNLISNQEFYGLKHIKIPVKKYGLLTEILPSTSSGFSKPDATTIQEFNSEIHSNIGTANRSSSPQDSVEFFKRMDEDLVKIILNAKVTDENITLNAVPRQCSTNISTKNTDYCGIKWSYLVVFVICLVVVVPTVVALYVYFWAPSSHLHSASSSNGLSTDDSAIDLELNS